MKLKQVVEIAGTVVQMQATVAALWFVTDWSIGKVALCGILLTAIIDAFLFCRRMALESINREPQVKRVANRRKFQVYDLIGEYIEEPTGDPEIKRIRHVVAGAQKNILQPTKAMQDVS